MPNRPIYWYEGMFLGPHHFQLADRQTRLSIKESEDWFHPFCWGLGSLDFDKDALATHAIVIRSCKARLKDGTRVSVPGDSLVEVPELADELKQALAKDRQATVYLAVPALLQGRRNVDADGEAVPKATGPRFWMDQFEVEDENTGEGPQMVRVLRLRSRLLLSGQKTSGYQVVPLMRIVASAEGDAAPRVDGTYVPPLLVIDAWPPLWEKVQALYRQVGGTIDALAAQAADRNLTFDSKVPGDAERLLMLSVLNGAYSHLQSFVFIKGLTPLDVYRELCRLAGQLSIFSPTRRAPELPPYDHDDLGRCFDVVLDHIKALLRPVGPRAYEKRYFQRAQGRPITPAAAPAGAAARDQVGWLQVGREPEWISVGKELFLGVESDLAPEDCHRLLQSLELKMGSATWARESFRQALPDLQVRPIIHPKDRLPGRGVVYSEIVRDQYAWPDVANSLTMAIQFNWQKVRFRDDKAVTVRAPGGPQTLDLRFALFVIDAK